MAALPPLDSSAVHIDAKGKPTKDFFNWIKSLANSVITGVGTGLSVSGGIVSLSPTVAFSVHKNGTDQTGVVDSTFTQITWSTELYDVGGYFSSSAWTPPPGKVSLTAAFLGSGTISAGAQVSIAIYKNGSDFRQGNWPALTNFATAFISIEDIATGSDVYSVSAYVDVSASTATITGNAQNTYFMGHWIGP